MSSSMLQDAGPMTREEMKASTSLQTARWDPTRCPGSNVCAEDYHMPIVGPDLPYQDTMDASAHMLLQG